MSNTTRDGLTATITVDRLNKDGFVDLPCNALKATICPVSRQLVVWTNGYAMWEDSSSCDIADLCEAYGTNLADLRAAIKAAR